MKIAISGASGFIGTYLSEHLRKRGYEVIALSRSDFKPEAATLLDNKLNACHGVINLAGASIAGRWTDRFKKNIYDSRILTTRRLVDSINRIPDKPAVFISTSAVGYYPTAGSYTEENALNGSGFLAHVCYDWEQEATQVDTSVRLAITRFGLVLSPLGGILTKLIIPFKYGLGVRIGPGTQPFPWIYLPDLLNIYDFILSHPEMHGAINCVSPELIDNTIFTEALAKNTLCPTLLTIPRWALRLLLKEGETLLSEGQKVYPDKLLKSGFIFSYPDIGQTLEDCMKLLREKD